MAEVPAPDYRVEPARLPEQAAAVVELWSQALGYAERRPLKLDWFYLRNPAGQPRLLLLVHDQRVVGVTGLGGRHLGWQGRDLDAALMGDFAVDSHHRTLYPALLLQRAALEQGLARHGLLYGFPNAKSLPVVRRAGYQVLPGMGRYARALHSEAYLPAGWPRGLRRAVGAGLDAAFSLRHAAGLLSAGRSLQEQWLEGPDARFDELWARARASLRDCVLGRRDLAFLRWRFEPRAWHRTRFVVLADARSGRLAGYAACEIEGAAMHVRDLLVQQPSARLAAQLLRLAARKAQAQGLRSLSMQCGGPPWLLAGLRAAGLRLREAGAQPMILALAPGTPASLAQASWYLTGADSDE
ncbi:MAG: GNAT family N-acetyltransferase [Betaproteobacteria bacterium]|nr:GNAT family N-acetyltransferase [Betaproteobacteria bacterium]